MNKQKYIESIANFINKSDKLGYPCHSSLDTYGNWHARVYHGMACLAIIDSNYSFGTHQNLDTLVMSKPEQKAIKDLLNNLSKYGMTPMLKSYNQFIKANR